jgi:hypothetical protein
VIINGGQDLTHLAVKRDPPPLFCSGDPQELLVESDVNVQEVATYFPLEA